MRGQSLSIGRYFGIDVRIHVSWLLAFAFITWGLATGYFRFINPRQGLALPLALGAISAVLLFASVLIHEFSHSLVAQARGMRVRDITLFIFGGVSNIGGEARTARDEFLISVVGPLTSFALAAVFWLIGQSVGGSSTLDFLGGSPRTLRGLTPIAAIFNYLTTINLILGAFNLVPAFPLDGGRVFRSIVWGITQRFSRATMIAATVGQGFAFLMMGLGLVRIAFGDLFGGLWTILIGWFLNQAASAARQDRTLREGLEGVPVSSVMDPSVPLVEAGMSLQQLVYEYLLRSERRRVITVEHGVPVGTVDASAVRAIPRERWPTTPVASVSTGISYCVSPDADAGAVLRKLEERDRLVPVVADGVVVGAVDLWRLLRFAQLRRELLRDLQVGSPRPSVV